MSRLTTGASWTNTSKYRYEHENGGLRYADTLADIRESVAEDGVGFMTLPVQRRVRDGWEHYGHVHRSSGGSVQILRPKKARS